MSHLYLVNGTFHTQDPARPVATAAAIHDGRIEAVGETEEIQALSRSKDRASASMRSEVIDLEGRRVLPGLTDAHFHFYDWALGLQRLRLAGLRSLAELQERLAQRAAETPAGRWILGQGWNESTWPAPTLPTRLDLDKVCRDHPVVLRRSDLHLVVANTLALSKAGITGSTPDPPEGLIDRDETGQPTGVLRELAINLVSEIIPPPSEEETTTVMREAIPELYRLGLTGVHDFRLMGGADGPPAFRAYQRLQDCGELALRLWMLLPGERLDEAIALGLRSGMGSDCLRLGHVKLFADGAQGPRTAWMLEPYLGTSHCGMPLTPMEEIAEKMERANRAGLAVAVHAIGDRATRELASVLEQFWSEREGDTSQPVTGRIPHRIEHVQNVRPEDVARLGRLGVVASVQPVHLADDMAMIEESVGSRARFAYRFREMLAAGMPLAFGSDCPVADPNPLWGIHAAVTRQQRDGTPAEGWYPAQRLTVAEAVWGYTMGPALACGRAPDLGSISPGKKADLVVLDRDIFEVEPAEIAETRVVMTIFDGELVYHV
jgi:predicted amidohydrolase YtcJ